MLDAIDYISKSMLHIDNNTNYWLVKEVPEAISSSNDSNSISIFLNNNIINVNKDTISDLIIDNIRNKKNPNNQENPPKFKDTDISDSELETKEIKKIDKIENVFKEVFYDSADSERSTNYYSLFIDSIRDFITEPRKGDIILTVLARQRTLKAGILIDDVIHSQVVPDNKKFNNDFVLEIKRKVMWLDKDAYDPYIYHGGFDNNNSGRSDFFKKITTNSDYINYYFFDFYKYKGFNYLTIDINKEGPIKSKDITTFLNIILGELDSFAKYYELEVNIDNLYIKININSPGKILFYGGLVLVALTAFYIASLTGTYKGKVGFVNVDFESEGLAKSLNEYQDGKQNRRIKQEIFDNLMKNLEVQDSAQFNKLLNLYIIHEELSKKSK